MKRLDGFAISGPGVHSFVPETARRVQTMHIRLSEFFCICRPLSVLGTAEMAENGTTAGFDSGDDSIADHCTDMFSTDAVRCWIKHCRDYGQYNNHEGRERNNAGFDTALVRYTCFP
jgi:hypothetical protein